jgi:hypothetical protein
MDDVEYATLEWVDWFNHRRLLEPIGHVPPAEGDVTVPTCSVARRPLRSESMHIAFFAEHSHAA